MAPFIPITTPAVSHLAWEIGVGERESWGLCFFVVVFAWRDLETESWHYDTIEETCTVTNKKILV